MHGRNSYQQYVYRNQGTHNELAQIDVARQDRYLASIVEREFDGEGDVSAVLNFLCHRAGGIDRQVLPAGGKC